MHKHCYQIQTKTVKTILMNYVHKMAETENDDNFVQRIKIIYCFLLKFQLSTIVFYVLGMNVLA